MLINGPKVCKFGGELKDTASFKTVGEIIDADPARRFIVVSALGGDERITSLLYAWSLPFGAANEKIAALQEKYGNNRELIFRQITERYTEIVAGLNIRGFDIRDAFERIRMQGEHLKYEAPEVLERFAASRGEFLSSRVLASYKGFRFLDAANLIGFTEQGLYDAELTKRRAQEIGLARMVTEGVVVMGGFYGSSPGGRIFTFDLGGSDRSMSIVGWLVGASVCENWKKTPGVLAADPHIVHLPHMVKEMTYGVARELTFMGNPVLQKDAIRPAWEAGIPIHVRGIDTPDEDGTWIRRELENKPENPVTGITGKRGYSVINIEKYGLHDETGVLARTAAVFAEADVGVMSGEGIDSLSFVAETIVFKPKEDWICSELRKRTGGAEVTPEHNRALICTAGDGMRDTVGISARNDSALARAGINIEVPFQSMSQTSMARAIKADVLDKGIRTIYNEFFSR